MENIDTTITNAQWMKFETFGFASSLNCHLRMMGHFVAFFASKEPPVEVDFLIELAKDGDVVPLERALIEFFQVRE